MSERNPVVAFPRDDELERTTRLGPHMAALTDMQRDFIAAYLESPMQPANAAKAAGYSASSTNNLRVTASRLLSDSKVQAALKEEAVRRLGSASVMAAAVVMEICMDPTVRASDRLKAAGMIMKATGIEGDTTVNVVISDDSAKMKRVQELAGVMGLSKEDVERMAGVVIETDWTTVKQPVAGDSGVLNLPDSPDILPDWVDGLKGLEDWV